METLFAVKACCADARSLLKRVHARRIRSQVQLHRNWQRITNYSGLPEHSLRCFFLAADGRATRKIITLTDVVEALEPDRIELLATWLHDVVDGIPGWFRFAPLITRPGRAEVRQADLNLAASIYEAVCLAQMGYMPIHLAASKHVIPLPLDDVLNQRAGA